MSLLRIGAAVYRHLTAAPGLNAVLWTEVQGLPRTSSIANLSWTAGKRSSKWTRGNTARESREQALVGVGVGGGQRIIGGQATVFDSAAGIVAHFKLDGSVVDVEILAQAVIDIGQNATAF
jgi:hypothetical protein